MEENLQITDERDGHRLRLRSRIIRSGFDHLPPHQILEFLLYYAVPRQDVSNIAHKLLDYFGDLKTVLHATLDELSGVPGIGSTVVEWMNLVNRCIFHCEKMEELPALRIKNYSHAFSSAPMLRRAFPDADMLQLCINAAGEVVYYLPLKIKNSWVDPDFLNIALRNAVMVQPHSVLVMAFMDEIAMLSPAGYERVQQYADTLSRSRCCLSDVILVGKWQIFSLRQQGMITREVSSARLRALHEDYMQNMPGADEMRYFEFAKPEDKHEPV